MLFIKTDNGSYLRFHYHLSPVFCDPYAFSLVLEATVVTGYLLSAPMQWCCWDGKLCTTFCEFQWQDVCLLIFLLKPCLHYTSILNQYLNLEKFSLIKAGAQMQSSSILPLCMELLATGCSTFSATPVERLFSIQRSRIIPPVHLLPLQSLGKAPRITKLT